MSTSNLTLETVGAVCGVFILVRTHQRHIFIVLEVGSEPGTNDYVSRTP